MGRTKKAQAAEAKKISKFLYDLRLQSKLTLMDIQEKSKKFREKVTFDYLSRAERGLLLPSLPKLLTLAKVYRISPTTFFDLIEIGEFEKLSPDIDDYQQCKTYGITCHQHGDLDRAIGAFSRCMEIIEKDKSIKNKEECLSEIYLCSATTFRHMGKLSLAKEDLEKAILFKNSSLSLQMRILNELANIYIEQENTKLATIFADEALRLAKNEKDLQTIATAYSSKAYISVLVGSFKEAERYYKEAIKIFKKIKLTANFITALNALGNCFIKNGHPEKSIEILEQAKLLGEKEGLKRIYTVSLINLGDAYRLMKQLERAKINLMQASIIAKEYEYPKSAFASNFYLWKIAIEEKDTAAEKELFASLKFYRTKVQELFDEIKEFDSILASQ